MKKIFLTLVLAFVFVSFTKEKEGTIENECNGIELIASNDLTHSLAIQPVFSSIEAKTDPSCEWKDLSKCGFVEPNKVLQVEICDGVPTGNTRLVDCVPG